MHFIDPNSSSPNPSRTIHDRFFSCLTRVQSKILIKTIDWNGMDKLYIQRMLEGSINEPFKRKGNQYVHRLEGVSGGFYLKRTSHEPARKILRNLLRGKKAYTNSGWIYIALKQLKSKGFLVMEPVAWSEECWLGIWPRRGFLLVKEAVGEELVDIVEGSTSKMSRTQALRAFGEYMGLLHGAGFFFSARVHDFIVVRTIDDGEEKNRLTMIDPDYYGRSPDSEVFEEDKCIASLAYACYLFLRVGHRMNLLEAHQFIIGYRGGLHSNGAALNAGWLRKLIGLIDQHFLNHRIDTSLMKIFPDVPGLLAEKLFVTHK